VNVATVPLQLALQELFNIGPILHGDPAQFNKQVGQWGCLLCGPCRARLGKLVSIDQVGLHRQHAEQQVAVGVIHGPIFSGPSC
jgi:hypothetical protein